MHAKSAPLLFPHVFEWGGLGAAFFFGGRALSRSSTLKGRQKGALCPVDREAATGQGRFLERGLLRATFATRARCMHRRGPWPLGPMLSVRTQMTRVA